MGKIFQLGSAYYQNDKILAIKNDGKITFNGLDYSIHLDSLFRQNNFDYFSGIGEGFYKSPRFYIHIINDNEIEILDEVHPDNNPGNIKIISKGIYIKK